MQDRLANHNHLKERVAELEAQLDAQPQKDVLETIRSSPEILDLIFKEMKAREKKKS